MATSSLHTVQLYIFQMNGGQLSWFLLEAFLLHLHADSHIGMLCWLKHLILDSLQILARIHMVCATFFTLCCVA